jgi:hypothetical protein
MSKAGVQHGLFGWLESGIADIQSLSVHFRFVPEADPQKLLLSGSSRTVPAEIRAQASRTSGRLRMPVANSPQHPSLLVPDIP